MHVTCKRVTILTSASARYTAVLQGRERFRQLKLRQLHGPSIIARPNYMIDRLYATLLLDKDKLLKKVRLSNIVPVA